MPPTNSRFMRADVELCGRVAKALGWRAKRTKSKPTMKDKEKHYEFEVQTSWGKRLVYIKKNDPNAAIIEAAPAFHEGHDESLMLAWLGRKAVHHDFEVTLKIIQKKGAQWAVVIKVGEYKKVFKRPVQSFPASRPIAEAVDYIHQEVLHGS